MGSLDLIIRIMNGQDFQGRQVGKLILRLSKQVQPAVNVHVFRPMERFKTTFQTDGSLI